MKSHRGTHWPLFSLSVAALLIGSASRPPEAVGMIAMTTGSDSAGYTMVDSEETGGPTLSWEDISTTGTVVYGAGATDVATSVPLGINFTYYGTDYTPTTQLGITTKGNIHFATPSFSFSPTTLPSATAPNGMICAFWADLDTAGGSVRREVRTNPNRAIFQWTNIDYYSGGGNEANVNFTFQIKLFESGAIVVNYFDMTGVATNSHSIGIENQNGTVGILYRFNGNPAANTIYSGLTIVYSQGNPPPPPTGLLQTGTAGGAPQPPVFISDLTAFFRGVVTDPDSTNQVRLQVEILPAATAFHPTNVTGQLATSPTVASGTETEAPYDFTTGPFGSGPYHWRARAQDTTGKTSAWVEFEPGAPVHLFVDLTPPADPVAVAPANVDIQSPSPTNGTVTLQWLESTDNADPSFLRYDIEVYQDSGLTNIEASVVSPAGTNQATVTLSVSRNPKYWRVRARDGADNLSNWSPVQQFRVVHDDQIDHASGDSEKTCGFGVPASSFGSLTGLLLGLWLLASAARRVTRRG